MHSTSHTWMSLLASAVIVGLTAGTPSALPSASPTLGMQSALGQQGVLLAGSRRNYDDDDRDAYYPRRYDAAPPPRTYLYVPPPAVYYVPPVYGWRAPPRPANCGQSRYWNGEYCADARYQPPYLGPRW